MKLNQKGFTLIEGLLVVIALTLVVGVGTYVVSQNKNKDSNNKTTTQFSTNSTKSPSVQQTKNISTTYDIGKKLTLTHPEDWKVEKELNSASGSEYQTEVGNLISPDGKVAIVIHSGIAGLGGHCDENENTDTVSNVKKTSTATKEYSVLSNTVSGTSYDAPTSIVKTESAKEIENGVNACKTQFIAIIDTPKGAASVHVSPNPVSESPLTKKQRDELLANKYYQQAFDILARTTIL
jgi:type II secretory pathway pseudopilin PulG